MKNVLTTALAVLAAIVLAAGAVCIGAVNGWKSEREEALSVGETNAGITEEHISRSPCCSVDKLYRVLGVKPDYTIMDIFREYLDYQESLKK